MTHFIMLTREIVERVLSGNWGLSDPCVICGEKFSSDNCTHTVHDTQDVIKRVRRLPESQREMLLKE